MIKAFVFISAILVSICPVYEGLVCYNCYMDVKHGRNDYRMKRCNEQNLTASETTTCPDPKSQCIYAVLDNDFKGPEIWRMCSDPKFEPCDSKAVPPGMKMVKCTFCDTDRCNLQEKSSEENTFTINIKGNISVSIEQ